LVGTRLLVAVAVILIIVAGVGGYYYGSLTAPGREVTTTLTSTTTLTLTAPYTTTVTVTAPTTMITTVTSTATLTPQPLKGQILKVGLVAPLTGPMASFGEQGKRGMEMAIDEINSAGGILGAQVQMIVENFAGDPKVAVAATEKVITVDKVQVVRVAFHSSSILAAMEVTEKYGIPLVTIGGVADEITTRGYKYIFRVCSNTTQVCSCLIEYVAKYFKPKTVAILHEQSLMGQSYVNKDKEIIRTLYPEWRILTIEPYDAAGLDFKPLLEKVRAMNPDVLIIHPYLTDLVLMLKQMDEIGYRPNMIISGGVPNLSLIEMLGDVGHYRVLVAEFWCDRAYNPSDMRAIALKFWKRYGTAFDFQAANGYLGMYIIKKAIEECGSLDPKAIRDALAKVDFEVPWFGHVKFLPNGQLIYSPQVLQIQPANPDEPWNAKGWTYHTVYPPEFATAEVKTP
jgi:branched-chain amino acid transport system substrate-binding protein